MTHLKLWLIVGLIVAAMAGLLIKQQQSVVRLREENQSLQQQVVQAAQLAADNERLSNSVNQAGTSERASQDQLHELLRLRGEVGQLRQKAKELVRVQEENRELRARPIAEPSPAPIQSARTVWTAEQARNSCINNLRQIDGAIQQCALENKLNTNDVVTAEQLQPYLKNHQDVFRCPSGGTYSFGPVLEVPTCSIPGHAIPTQ